MASSHFAATPQSDVVRICAHDFQCRGDAFGTTENACFLCIYNPQITISPTPLFSANFNGNRVKNHPKPWTRLLSTMFTYLLNGLSVTDTLVLP